MEKSLRRMKEIHNKRFKKKWQLFLDGKYGKTTHHGIRGIGNDWWHDPRRIGTHKILGASKKMKEWKEVRHFERC